jgi:protein-disulfide isomerase
MSGEEAELRSAPLPPVSAEDWVRGPAGGATVIEYGDYECPYCAVLARRLEELRPGGEPGPGSEVEDRTGVPPRAGVLAAAAGRGGLRVVFRHFPIRSSHPRAWPAACAAEAAGLQGSFWAMHDALFADPARLEDPHLWERARRLGLDLERFDADRRSAEVAERVTRSFRSGIRAGVASTPTVFLDGVPYAGDALRAALEG